MAYKTFVAGEEALAADVNSYLMGQTVARFPNASARTSQLPAPATGQLSSLDTNPGSIEYWTGSAWMPNRELWLVPFTTTITVATGGIGAAVTVIAPGPGNYDGTPIMLEFFAPTVVPPTVASGQLMLNLWDGGTDLGYWGTVLTPGGQLGVPVLLRRRLVPTAGSHSYAVKAWCPTGSGGQVAAGAGGVGVNPPGYLSATRV